MDPSQAKLDLNNPTVTKEAICCDTDSLAVSLEPSQMVQSDTESENDENPGCIYIHPKSLPLPNLLSDLELQAAEIKKLIEAIQVNLTFLISSFLFQLSRRK